MQFNIKGQDYFLAFVEQEKRWYVFAPTVQGIHRIPVYEETPKFDRILHDESSTHTTRN